MEYPSRTEMSVYVGLGSNLGDRERHMRGAIDWFDRHPQLELISYTNIVETEPWGLLDQPLFLNAVVEIKTTLDPHQLLGELKKAERELGRSEEIVKWGPREIDLDILIYGDLVVDTKDLKIPHPHLLDRQFVITQLLELNPDLVHPLSKVSLNTCLKL